jgi:hypothetical protein
MATQFKEILTDADWSPMRLALEERVISLLGLYGRWSAEAEKVLALYYRLGGYFTREQFEKFAKNKRGWR